MTTTTDPRDLLHRAITVFGDRLAVLDHDDLDAPTPCEGWTVRDLVDHVVEEALWTPPLLAGETVADAGDALTACPAPQSPRPTSSRSCSPGTSPHPRSI